MNHGNDKIADEHDSDDTSDNGFHNDAGLEGVAKYSVTHADDEKANSGSDIDEIGHDGGGVTPSCHEMTSRVVKGQAIHIKKA